MRYHSPKTGRFISKAAFNRWYAPGKELRKEYNQHQREIQSRHRSEAAKRGWETRRSREAEAPPVIEPTPTPEEEMEDYLDLEEDMEVESDTGYEEGE